VYYVAGIVFYTNVLSAFCIAGGKEKRKKKKKKPPQETRIEKYECEL
jgi:hypothetical protein